MKQSDCDLTGPAFFAHGHPPSALASTGRPTTG
jgi:hypothetical protein